MITIASISLTDVQIWKHEMHACLKTLLYIILHGILTNVAVTSNLYWPLCETSIIYLRYICHSIMKHRLYNWKHRKMSLSMKSTHGVPQELMITATHNAHWHRFKKTPHNLRCSWRYIPMAIIYMYIYLYIYIYIYIYIGHEAMVHALCLSPP